MAPVIQTVKIDNNSFYPLNNYILLTPCLFSFLDDKETSNLDSFKSVSDNFNVSSNIRFGIIKSMATDSVLETDIEFFIGDIVMYDNAFSYKINDDVLVPKSALCGFYRSSDDGDKTECI
ncbi:hypothetical protein M0R19_04045 [Candidatus Pacearchaeota archaeon]|jgi:hypothetical protein|nr:hypothetical protein [Candidatus Pacearchaeota archaeon]